MRQYIKHSLIDDYIGAYINRGRPNLDGVFVNSVWYLDKCQR